MNENINLVEILKDCPEGTPLYSTIYSTVNFIGINQNIQYPIVVEVMDNNGSSDMECFTFDGKYHDAYNGECVLFPSKEQRDWSKFKMNKPKFDPKILKAFDKVLVRDREGSMWNINMFSYICSNTSYPYNCLLGSHKCCIPYNDETKHLVGTHDEAPEYYRYWED